jgi:hypothetical protein
MDQQHDFVMTHGFSLWMTGIDDMSFRRKPPRCVGLPKACFGRFLPAKAEVGCGKESPRV